MQNDIVEYNGKLYRKVERKDNKVACILCVALGKKNLCDALSDCCSTQYYLVKHESGG
ncbi:hypothetical protein JZU46_06570 [bacterium]|nr:hypothetical protein [bacterium]